MAISFSQAKNFAQKTAKKAAKKTAKKLKAIENVKTSIAALVTLINYLPTINTLATEGIEGSFDFMFNILEMLGVTKQEVIDWIAKMLGGFKENGAKKVNGVLDEIEDVVKLILMANIKKMFTCSINPLLPDDLMEYVEYFSEGPVGGEGISIDLNAVDLYGTLEYCPTDTSGTSQYFYFDAAEPIYNMYLPEEKHIGPLTPNTLWQSCDFNAFLWYVVSKGTNVGIEGDKLYWDNRGYFTNWMAYDNNLRAKFFRVVTDEGTRPDYVTKTPRIIINGDDYQVNKERYIKCVFTERQRIPTKTNILKVYLNPYRYWHTREIKIPIPNLKKKTPEVSGTTNNEASGGTKEKKYIPIKFNRTIFEFNWEYIASLKLFDSTVVVANVINAIMGIAQNSVTGSISVKRDPSTSSRRAYTEAKVRELVEQIITIEDTQVDDCYFTFSNEDYDRMLEDSVKKHEGINKFTNQNFNVDYATLLADLSGISHSATLHEKVSNISKTYNDVISALAAEPSFSEETQVNTNNVRIEWTDNLFPMIKYLIQETVTQIVMQILSPKVAILFKINSYVMGDIDPQNFDDDSWLGLIKHFKNVITKLVIEIRNIIIKQLYNWVLEQLQPILKAAIIKLLLEAIKYYKELIESLINCFNQYKNLIDSLLKSGGNSTYTTIFSQQFDIGDVDYADIIPSQTHNDQIKC